jgi:hypothetical protein
MTVYNWLPEYYHGYIEAPQISGCPDYADMK